jgi:hypothetical protein
MTQGKTYDLFISHGWSKDEQYSRLIAELDTVPDFKWKNHSDITFDPNLDPVTDVGYYTLRKELEGQIGGAGCVVVLSIERSWTRRWIQHELQIATGQEKPIVGIKPEIDERRPQWEQLESVANEMVDWDIDAIVAAVKRCSL